MATIILLVGVFGLFSMPFMLLGAVINARKQKKRRRQNIEDMKEAYAAATAIRTTPKAEVQNIPLEAFREMQEYHMYGSQR